MGPAGVADSVPEQEGFQMDLGLLEIAESIFTGPREIAYGFLFDLRHRDRGEIPRARQAGQWHGVSAVRFDPITGLVGIRDGTTTQPSSPFFVR